MKLTTRVSFEVVANAGGMRGDCEHTASVVACIKLMQQNHFKPVRTMLQNTPTNIYSINLFIYIQRR